MLLSHCYSFWNRSSRLYTSSCLHVNNTSTSTCLVQVARSRGERLKSGPRQAGTWGETCRLCVGDYGHDHVWYYMMSFYFIMLSFVPFSVSIWMYMVYDIFQVWRICMSICPWNVHPTSQPNAVLYGTPFSVWRRTHAPRSSGEWELGTQWVSSSGSNNGKSLSISVCLELFWASSKRYSLRSAHMQKSKSQQKNNLNNNLNHRYDSMEIYNLNIFLFQTVSLVTLYNSMNVHLSWGEALEPPGVKHGEATVSKYIGTVRTGKFWICFFFFFFWDHLRFRLFWFGVCFVPLASSFLLRG